MSPRNANGAVDARTESMMLASFPKAVRAGCLVAGHRTSARTSSSRAAASTCLMIVVRVDRWVQRGHAVRIIAVRIAPSPARTRIHDAGICEDSLCWSTPRPRRARNRARTRCRSSSRPSCTSTAPPCRTRTCRCTAATSERRISTCGTTSRSGKLKDFVDSPRMLAEEGGHGPRPIADQREIRASHQFQDV